MTSTIRIALQAIIAAALVSAIAPSVPGWQDGSGQAGGLVRSGGTRPESDSERRARDRREREFNLRMAEREGRRPIERRETRLDLAQIKEDFMRIQIINDALVKTSARADALDLKFVSKSAAEIRKRAERLKYNLALPETEKDVKPPKAEVGAEVGLLKSSLSALDKLINGFVTNPAFASADVVDAQSAVKARRDLEAIIELSGGIKKSGEKLSKVAQKSQ
ncbi:MAG: hypothetical protein M3430_08785 [Acidobacteriota bacterium]|nr:hypothetical protein [Acidobacteriota bacterium]